jgi:RNA polymerase I-specific transcription initiation factor RRN7
MRKASHQNYGFVSPILSPGVWSADRRSQTIVRDLWALRLSTLAHKLDTTLSTVESEDQPSSSAEESGEAVGRKASRTFGKGIDSPRLVETVGLCYMGMLLLRLPIGLADLYR